MEEQELVEIVKKLNDKRNVSFKCDEVDYRMFKGEVQTERNVFHTLTILFPTSFPLQLPQIRVVDYDKRYAHMESDGKLCLVDRSSILIKTTMPDQILIDCFDRACELLAVDTKSDDYANEIMREFDSYWLANARLNIYSILDEKEYGYSEMKMFVSRSVHVLASSLNEGKFFACNYLNAIDDDKSFVTKCIVISLRKKSKPIVLKESYKWSEIRRYILENVSGSVKRRFKKFLGSYARELMRYIVISLPGEYGNVMFGFRVEFNNKKKEKIEKITSAKVQPVYIQRADRGYMLQRSGGETALSKKNVLLLGCGSVGGYIANNLCQLGIGAIDLLDNDFFSRENVHRHFLGFDSLTESITYKSVLLKNRLEKMYPYADIDSLDYTNRSVENFIIQKERLKNYDLIISALGEPTLNLEINRVLYEEGITTPFLSCFNEPYGIGGHVIAVNISHDSCLRCLYTDTISEDLVSFRASFVKENQYFKKNISGCSSAFVPYSCLDSQQTAIMASRLAIKILKKQVEQNEINSWVGDDTTLRDAGFVTSDFYKRKNIGDTEKMAIPVARYCPVCHSKDRVWSL